MRLKVLSFTAMLSLLGGSSALAQNANEIFNLFSGMVQTAIAQATLEQWQKLPQSEVACVDRALLQRGSSLRTLISQGIAPSDRAVASERSLCRGQLAQQPSTSSPSFDCAKAAYPDERTICSNIELSQLDNVANAGYEYVRRAYGAQRARSVTLPLLLERRACGPDVACIKDRQIAAIKTFQGLGAPTANPENTQPGPSLWSHNGSTVYLVAEGRSRKFFYKAPRPGMLSAGANPDSLVFEGEAIDNQYQGTAYLFNRRCGQSRYQVSGPVLDNYRRVELRGRAPRMDDDCRTIGFADDLLQFQLIEANAAPHEEPKVTEAPSQSTAPPLQTDSEKDKRPAEPPPLRIDPEEERRLAAERATKKKLAELEEAKLCQHLKGAKPYFVAACVARGMEQGRQTEGLRGANAQVESAKAGLDCTPDALGILQKLSDRSAAKILSSAAISKLMDFADAMTLECKKAADINLE